MRLSSLSLSLSFIMQVPSRIQTSLSPFYFKEKSRGFWLVVLLDTLKYSRKPVVMAQYMVSFHMPGALTQRITIPSVVAPVMGAQAL